MRFIMLNRVVAGESALTSHRAHPKSLRRRNLLAVNRGQGLPYNQCRCRRRRMGQDLFVFQKRQDLHEGHDTGPVALVLRPA